MLDKKYSIGLDIGTNSVGWAVVDETNQLVRKNGFTLWGVRMFNESQSSAERRNFRSSRRRLARRKERINLLRKLFNDEITKVDPTFFQRLDESFYKFEDKTNAKFNNLFQDLMTDQQFYEKFPTIYHLRKYLMESNQKEDIRFTYLALHHMIKYRGNFLYPGNSFNINNDDLLRSFFGTLSNVISVYTNEMEEYEDYFENIAVDEKLIKNFETVMSGNYNKAEKKIKLLEVFGVEKNTLVNECIIPLLISHKLDFSKLKPVKDLNYPTCEISLESESLDSDIQDKTSIIPEFYNLFEILNLIKDVIDYFYLRKLLGKSNSLSESMVNRYDMHREDLKKLKAFIKKYVPEKYNECFKKFNEKIDNYPRYIGMTNVNANMQRFEHCSKDSFYSYIKKIVNQVETNDELKRDILDEIEKDNFLLRQNSSQNGSIPMQLNLTEMEKILENQKEYYDFLNQADDSGYSVYEKIILIFKYKIPYYVGPLNVKSNNSWVIKNNNEKIYPWNFNKIVNIDGTATAFIQKMQNKCTYLKGENDYCLPKQSIIFSKYNCLSYLNKLNINGTLIDKKTKMDIFENVFLVKKKPTKKDIYDYLETNYGKTLINTSLKKELPEVNCNMSSYIKFKEIFNKPIEDNLSFYEQIIKDITIFEDKTILEKRLEKIYKLDRDIIKSLKDLNYSGYGSLCNKLLYEIPLINDSTGERFDNVLQVMEETNYNLQEILYNDFNLINYIDEYNKANTQVSENETVEEFLNRYSLSSPIMKRPLIQTYNIIKEVRQILQQPIDKYYVECTRTNKEKMKKENKVSKSRYDKILELYKTCKSFDFGLDKKEIECLLMELEKNKENLKSDSLYLYFTQLGRCMYSLEPIDLDVLIRHNEMYDIDHIYPQSLIKDDSMSNRVLVLKEKNNDKSDNMIFELSNFLHPEAFRFYQKLYDSKLISKEKYLRLTKKELSQGELDTFVNRQIVSTSQAVKGLVQVLKYFDRVDASNIIYSKAENIAAARQMFDWPKSRLANNFHHAHDAYLNAVIGSVVNTYFTINHFKNIKDYYRFKADNLTTNIKILLSKNRFVNNKCYWDKEKMIKQINYDLYQRYDVSETKKTYNDDNLFSKVSIRPHGKGTVKQKLTGPRSNIEAYGGIDSYKYYKYMLIENNSKKGKEYVLEAIPTAYLNKESLYLDNIGYKEYKIVVDNVKSNCIVEYGYKKFYISGKTGNEYGIINARDRYFNKYFIKVIKKLEKYNDNNDKGIKMYEIDNEIILSVAKEKQDSIKITKEEMVKLFSEITNKYSKDVYLYSSIKIEYIKNVNFDNYNIKELIELNTALLNILQTNAGGTINLKLIGLSEHACSLRISKKFKATMKLVSESVTGYYKKVLFEVPLNVI